MIFLTQTPIQQYPKQKDDHKSEENKKTNKEIKKEKRTHLSNFEFKIA
jgi:hypothetical protein